MVYIAYFSELNLQNCDYAQKRRNCKYVLDENFHGHFCPRRKATKFCRPVFEQLFTKTGKYVYTLFEGLRVCSLG